MICEIHGEVEENENGQCDICADPEFPGFFPENDLDNPHLRAAIKKLPRAKRFTERPPPPTLKYFK